MCVWCAAHKIDLIAKAYEDCDKVGPILRFLRRLVNHVKSSSGAQAALQGLHASICEDEKSCPQKMNFVPQRFISHHACAKALVKSFRAICSYLHTSSQGPENPQNAWARAMSVDSRELESWLILAICADFLQILKRVNLYTQRTELRILQVEQAVETCRNDLRDYIFPGTGKLATALKRLFQAPTSGSDSVSWSFHFLLSSGPSIILCGFGFLLFL